MKAWLYRHSKLSTFFACLLMYFLTCLSYVLLKPLYYVEGTRTNGVVPQCICIGLIGLLLVGALILLLKKKLTFERIVNLVLIISFIIKICYMICTPVFSRQHDVGSELYEDGHYAYAVRIFQTWLLPETNNYQYYHPPLNATIQAIFMNINKPLLEFGNLVYQSKVFDTTDTKVLFGSVQILSVMYMMISIIFVCMILNNLKVSNIAKLLGITFIALFPQFTNLAAQVNNDAVCIMFSFIAVYLSLIWKEKRDYVSIWICGLFIGLAMMAKLNGSMICLSIAVIFIWEFIKDIINKCVGKTVIQYIVFLMICAPLGLWFTVYAKIRFNQDLGFVFNNLNPALSVTQYNFFERFINIFDFKDMSKSLFCNAFEDYNLFGYLIKSSILGEYSYWNGEGFALVAIILNYLLVLLMLVLTVFYIVKTKKKNIEINVFAVSFIVFQASFILYFNIVMPYGCTMDFRYIVPILIGFAMLMTLFVDEFKENKTLNIFMKVVASITIVMVSCSSLFYLVCI